MKKYLTCNFFIIITIFALSGQQNSLLNKCILSAGPEAKYIKDFNIQLGEKHSQNEFRYKATLALRKKTIYRFTLCTADNSNGQLILNIRDNANKTVLSSFDQKTGTVYPYVDLVCNKNGRYQICFDFTEGQSGSGMSIVSLIH
jgi:hypothetical protein